MAFKKVQKINNVTSVNTRQEIRRELIPNQEVVLKKETKKVSEQEFSNELERILLNNSSYSNSTGRLSVADETASIDPDYARWLKTSNRQRAVEQREKIKKIESIIKDLTKDDENFIEFSIEEFPDADSFMSRYFNDYSPGIIKNSQYPRMKELEVATAEKQGQSIVSSKSKDSLLYSFLEDKDAEAVDQDYFIGMTESIEIFEEFSISSNGERAPRISTGYAMAFPSALDARQQNDAIIRTLNRIDSDTSAIDAIFNLGDDDDFPIRANGSSENFKFKDIFENCFDCFIEGMQSRNGMFTFNFNTELRLREAIASLDAIISALETAINLPAMISANLCSLTKIGALCPIEIAFIISNLVSLTRFLMMEVIINWKGFLTNLIVAILRPLIGGISALGNAVLNPFNVYFGCVTDSLLGLSVPSGNFSRRELSEAINGKAGQRFDEIREKLIGVDPAILSALSLSPTTIGTENILDWIQEGSGLNLDPTEYVNILLNEANQKITNGLNHINNTLDGLNNWSSGSSSARMQAVAKIIATSTILSIVISMFKFAKGDRPICEKIIDDDGTERFIPSVDPTEIIEGSDIIDIVDIEPGIDDETEDPIIIDGNPVYNTLNVVSALDQKFKMKHCSKSKRSNVSKDEIQSMLSQLGI